MLDLILTSQKDANVTPIDSTGLWTASGDPQTHMRVLFSSDAGQFQLLFLLLPCAVSVPSPFPVPFPVPFVALSRGPASKNVFLVSFVETKLEPSSSGVSPLRAQPAPAPGASTQSAPRTQPATRRRPVPGQRPQHPAPAPSTRALLAPRAPPAPSTGTLSPPRAEQGIATYDLARKRLCAQKYARKQQSP